MEALPMLMVPANFLVGAGASKELRLNIRVEKMS